ncbi:MAG: hypothetical protein R3300_07675 [Candidatus Promineifilaceae bacterium]|nr:hypothetical protein [Candidatus Promineifilaceae bacterium]
MTRILATLDWVMGTTLALLLVIVLVSNAGAAAWTVALSVIAPVFLASVLLGFCLFDLPFGTSRHGRARAQLVTVNVRPGL